ncbi:MAG: DUF4010 domain-containing protein [Candidatus Undinarchaeales archaeon]
MAITDFLTGIIPPVAKYILFPIYVTLGLYIGIVLLARKKGVVLHEKFHGIFFLITLFLTYGAAAFFITPSSYMLPLGDLAVRNIIGLTVLAILLQYLIYIGSIFLSLEQTTISLGFGAGLRRSTLAASTLAPKAAEDESFSWTAGTSIMLANTVAIARNFLIMLIIGAFLGFYLAPPKTFVLPMGVMFLISASSTGIFYKKSGGAEKIKFEPVSITGTLLFVSFFVVMYYIIREILAGGLFFVFYALAGILGFLYGAAHILIITILFLTGYLGPEVGLIGAFLVTAGSIISDIPYTYFTGADELTKIIAVSEIATISAGFIAFAYLII